MATNKPKDQWQPRPVKYDEVPKNGFESPKDSDQKPDLRFCTTYEPINGALAEKTSYRTGAFEHFKMSHSGSGYGWYNNGEYRMEITTGGGVCGTGGWYTAINGNLLTSLGGSVGQRSTGSSDHCANHGTGVGGGCQYNEGKTTGQSKKSGDTHACDVYAGDYGMVVPGVAGMAFGSLNMKCEGNMALGTVDGSGSITSLGNFGVGSQDGTLQMGGKGVAVNSEGPTSIRAKGADMNVFADGGNFVCSGNKIYLNCSSAPPKTPEIVTAETGKAGKNAQKYTATA